MISRFRAVLHVAILSAALYACAGDPDPDAQGPAQTERPADEEVLSADNISLAEGQEKGREDRCCVIKKSACQINPRSFACKELGDPIEAYSCDDIYGTKAGVRLKCWAKQGFDIMERVIRGSPCDAYDDCIRLREGL